MKGLTKVSTSWRKPPPPSLNTPHTNLYPLPFSKPTGLIMGVGRYAVRNGYNPGPTFKEMMAYWSKDSPLSS